MRYLDTFVWMAAVVAASVPDPLMLPLLTTVPSDPHLYVGTHVTLKCETESNEDLLYTFYKDDRFLQTGSDNTYEMKVSIKDTGDYSCKASTDDVESDDSDKYRIEVTVPQMPDLIPSPFEKQVFKGSHVTMACEIEPGTDHGVSYTFFKNNKPIQKGQGDYNMITIEAASAKDTANYTCSINKYGAESERSETHTLMVIEKCDVPVDLLFLVEASETVDDEEFLKAKYFVKKMLSRFNVNPSVTRVAVVLFDEEPHDAFCFNKYNTTADVMQAVDDLECEGCKDGDTEIGAALAYGRTNYFTGDCGARVDSNRLVVVLVDGKTSEDISHLGHEADEMRDVADEVITVGVGDDVDMDELELIATDEALVFTTSHYNKLDSMVDQISKETCLAVVE